VKRKPASKTGWHHRCSVPSLRVLVRVGLWQWIVRHQIRHGDCVAAIQASSGIGRTKHGRHGRDQQGCAGHHIRNHFLFPSAGALSLTMPVIWVRKKDGKEGAKSVCLCCYYWITGLS
jgi:hypothetical protein